MITKRTIEEVYAQLDEASEAQENGSKFPGMSYEDGVEAAIKWLIGETDEAPMDE